MAPKKKILHVYSSMTAGGAEKMMIELAAGLNGAGLENIIAGPKNSYIVRKAAEKGLKSYALRINGSFDPLGIIGLRSIVRKEKVDIIHAHQGKVFWPCVFMKIFVNPGLKLVFHRHAQLPHSFYSRGHYNFADKVIAISQAVAKGLIEREKVPQSKVVVVYNGIDLNRFNVRVSGEKIRKEYGLGNRVVIGTAAAMNRPKGKGQKHLIEAAKNLKVRYPDLRYIIAGSGEIKGELEDAAGTLGVSDIVIFSGYRENIEEYIAAMDIFCLLSWDTEGLGQVMMEAQAMGKAVIGTKIGGVPETFINGRTGILIPPENTDELSKAIEYLTADRGRLAGFGKEASEYASRNFGINKMVDSMAGIYESMWRSDG
ncbi:MAG: glycosyltransferase family 4 protein [Elusimicrobiota bacterium]